MKRTFAALRNKTSLISVPMNLGQPSLGLDRAPMTLIENGLINLLGDIGWRWKQLPPLIVDDSNSSLILDPEINAKNCFQVGLCSKTIMDHVKPECEGDNFPLILGGDHCISIGTISAIKSARKNTAVVWVDAHGDINTPKSSASGNMHGMPLAFLLGLVDDANKLPGFHWFKPTLDPKDIVYIGLRDLDKAEKSIIKKLGIKAFTMYDVDRLGMGRVMEEVISYVGDRPIHLSFDIDAIDPFFAPHTGTAVTGGLTYREGNYLCEALFESGKLSSMELVEFDPSQHQGLSSQQTIQVALNLIGSAMGKRIL